MTLSSDRAKAHRVTIGDWFLAGISLVATLMALALIRVEFRASMVMLAMFGSGLVVSTHIIRRKLRLQRLGPIDVTVAGGVPIRPSKGRIAKLGIGFLVVGVVFVLYGKQNGNPPINQSSEK